MRHFFLITFCIGILLSGSFCQTKTGDSAQITTPAEAAVIEIGASQLDAYLPKLQGKKVALVVNHTALVQDNHLLDVLLDQKIAVVKVFAPEHGFRGTSDAGASVEDGKDRETGIPIQSLYGKNKRPSQADLQGVDVVIFDIQDVGARFYTFISTMYYALDACAEYDVEMLVLDRPNPNGHYIDGPVRSADLASFVGIAPIPIVHGCTVGELAKMFVGEGWLPTGKTPKLTVVPCLNYAHHMAYELPVPPSPNLPNMRAVYLYPSLCLFEGTTFSVGRGTQRQFQVFGHPDIAAINTQFRPKAGYGAKYPKHENKICNGKDFSFSKPADLFEEGKLNFSYLISAYQAMPDRSMFFNKNNFFEKLAGTTDLRSQIENGFSEAQMRDTWQADLEVYKAIRTKYLLYK